MSATKFAKNSREWQMFVDYWNLCQRYWIVEHDSDYWRKVTEESVYFGEKYKDIPLASKIAIAFLETLQGEEEHKNQTGSI